MMNLLFTERTKKYVSGTLIAAICAVLAFQITLSQPKKAEAFLGCGVEAEALEKAGQALEAAETLSVPVKSEVANFRLNIASKSAKQQADRTCYLNAITKGIAKAVVHALVSSVIDWINRGFEGGPTFVTNPERFFGNIADQEIGRIIDGSALGWVCDPFKLQLQVGFLQQRSRHYNPSRCTITGIVKNFQGFVGGDFAQGGIAGWVQLTTKPQNNPYGSYLLAQESLDFKVAGRQNVASLELNWGKGFKSLIGADGDIKTPGTMIEDTLSKTTGQDFSDLNLAREFDDIVIALVNLGISKVMTAGLR